MNTHSHHEPHTHNPKEIHAHEHHRPRAEQRKSLMGVMILTFVMMLIEFIGAYVANSLSLLSDAVHMLTHFFSMSVSYLAIILALREAPEDKTFNYWRFEVLASLLNGVLLLPMVGYIFYESWQRLNQPESVEEWPMMLVAFSGLLINLVCVQMLHSSSKHDLNIRGAFLHMLADAFSSIGVIIAGIIIALTGWMYADPLAAFFVGIFVLYWAFSLMRDSCRILLEAVPSHINIEDVVRVIEGVDGVKDAHDIHVWVITSNMYSLTAHIILDQDLPVSQATAIVEKVEYVLDDRFDINHSCIQLESCTEECND